MALPKRASTVDYTFPFVKPGEDTLTRLDVEYERCSGKPGLLYVYRPGDGSRVYSFATGEVRYSRQGAIRYLTKLLKSCEEEETPSV